MGLYYYSHHGALLEMARNEPALPKVYKTVARMLYFLFSVTSREDLFWEALITEYFGKLVQRRLGDLPGPWSGLREGCALVVLLEKELQAISTTNYPSEC